MQYFQRFLKNFMPITVIVGIVCTTSSAMAASSADGCNTAQVNLTGVIKTTMLNTEADAGVDNDQNSCSTVGFGTLNNTMYAAVGVYECTSCGEGYTLTEKNVTDNTANCGVITYKACVANTVDATCTCTSSSTKCASCSTTTYSCPPNWILSGTNCTRTALLSDSDETGYYRNVYEQCAANQTTSTCKIACEGRQTFVTCPNGETATCVSNSTN